MTRLEANREIIRLLTEYMEKYPDMRFSQLLYNLDIVYPWRDEYNVESECILTRMRATDE
jgi:hypothetical protein